MDDSYVILIVFETVVTTSQSDNVVVLILQEATARTERFDLYVSGGVIPTTYVIDDV